MKNVKLKIVSATIAFSIILAGIPFGQVGNTWNTVQASGLTQQIAQYREDIMARKQTVMQNYQTNVALGKEIEGKKNTVKNMAAKIKDSQKQLNADDISKIKAQAEAVNGDVTRFTSTNKTISDDFVTALKDIGTRSFEKIKTDLDNIIAVQNERTQDLEKLNADMDTMINLLQTAISNSQIS